MRNGARSKSVEEKRILDVGITAAEISRVFGVKPEAAASRISKMKPNGVHDERQVYHIREVAAFFGRPTDDLIERVMRLNHMDLPPMLRKEYWTGEAQRLKVLQQKGELWSTADVISLVGESYRSIRMQLLLFPDVLARDGELTEKQRDTIVSLIDALMREIAEKLKDTANAKRPEPDGGIRVPGRTGNAELDAMAADL